MKEDKRVVGGGRRNLGNGFEGTDGKGGKVDRLSKGVVPLKVGQESGEESQRHVGFQSLKDFERLRAHVWVDDQRVLVPVRFLN